MARKATLSLDDLLRSTQTRFPNRFKGAKEARPRIPRLTITPFVGVKTLSFRADVQGVAEARKYKVIILFEGVEFSKTRDREHTVKIQVTENLFAFMKPIKKSFPARVRCSCQDFFFTFGIWDFNEGALVGVKPRPYVRKTTTFPERNPSHSPGMCKHIIGVNNKLRSLTAFMRG